MVNKTANQSLEATVGTIGVLEIVKSEEFINCHGCGKPIEKGKEYVSKCGNLYCKKDCFDFYTED